LGRFGKRGEVWQKMRPGFLGIRKEGSRRRLELLLRGGHMSQFADTTVASKERGDGEEDEKGPEEGERGRG